MTDPLLTIEDATREYRVSPKTIRRRLSAGEIDGAYKRPGQRGPEWVIPRGALEAAGFVRRADVPVAELPEVDAARADYWERRALDAEAALRSAGAGRAAGGAAGNGRPLPGDRADGAGEDGRADRSVASAPAGGAGGGIDAPPEFPRGDANASGAATDLPVVSGAVPSVPAPVRRPATISADESARRAGDPPRRARRLAAGLAVLVVALLAGVLALAAGDDGSEPSPSARGPAATVEAVLGTITDPGDPVGVLGDAARRLVPDGRRPVPASQLADEGGRYVLAAFDAPREPTAVLALRRSAAVVLDLAHDGGTVVVFDTGTLPGGREVTVDGTAPVGPTDEAASAPQPEPTDPTAPVTDGAEVPADDAVQPSERSSAPDPDDAPEPDSAPSAAPDASDPSVADPTPASPGSSQDPGPTTPDAVSSGAPEATAADPSSAPATPGTVVVQPGGSFWTIAVDLVVASGTQADAGTVTPVWSALVAANTDRLVEPGNPDLLHVGQTLVVPGG